MAKIEYGKKEIKLCKTCKHYTYTDCWSPQNMGHTFVIGVAEPVGKPYNLRDEEDKCGNEGKWWESVK